MTAKPVRCVEFCRLTVPLTDTNIIGGILPDPTARAVRMVVPQAASIFQKTLPTPPQQHFRGSSSEDYKAMHNQRQTACHLWQPTVCSAWVAARSQTGLHTEPGRVPMCDCSATVRVLCMEPLLLRPCGARASRGANSSNNCPS